MNRIYLRDSILGMMLVAAGIAAFALTIKFRHGDVSLTLWHGAGALVGAGLLMPIKHPWIGALCGMVGAFLFLYWLYARTF